MKEFFDSSPSWLIVGMFILIVIIVISLILILKEGGRIRIWDFLEIDTKMDTSVQYSSTSEQIIKTTTQGLQIKIDNKIVNQVTNQDVVTLTGQLIGNYSHCYTLIVYVITDIEYEQGSCQIDRNGFWKLRIHLGGYAHKVYFKFFDQNNSQIAVSDRFEIFKRID